PVPEAALPSPCILHRLPGGFALHMHEQRKLAGWIDALRRDEQAVKRDAFINVHTKEFGLWQFQLGQFLPQFVLRLEHPNRAMLGQRNQSNHGRRSDAGVRVHGPLRIFSNVVAVRARLIGG
ncbi:MAG: hypothetical protein JWR15_1715, partial [Prosthecobacter sp.]|nr:hypothetical protein [Prosthecobacter sp.]